MEATATLDPEVSLLPPLMQSLRDVVDGIEAADQMIAVGHAWRTRMIEQSAGWAELAALEEDRIGRRNPEGWSAEVVARRTVSSELAAALHVTERAAENMIEAAKALVRRLPQTMALLSEGRISYRHAEKVAEHSYSVPADATAEFDAGIASFAVGLTVAQLDDRARRLRERLHPETMDERHRAALDTRRVETEHVRDGMSWVNLLVPTEKAIGIYNRATDIAYAMRRGDGAPGGQAEKRTLAQLRADVLCDLLLDGEIPEGDAPRGIRPTVYVTVPVLTLLGADDVPGSLDGYGPISPEVARELTAQAPSLYRLLTHPETGIVLSWGRKKYTVPKDLRAWLRVRDGTCRQPGCRNPAATCDLDHSHDWQYGGGSDHDNLAHLCGSHHRLKHHTAWRLEQLGGGVMRFTSPSGRDYITRPALDLG